MKKGLKCLIGSVILGGIVLTGDTVYQNKILNDVERINVSYSGKRRFDNVREGLDYVNRLVHENKRIDDVCKHTALTTFELFNESVEVSGPGVGNDLRLAMAYKEGRIGHIWIEYPDNGKWRVYETTYVKDKDHLVGGYIMEDADFRTRPGKEIMIPTLEGLVHYIPRKIKNLSLAT